MMKIAVASAVALLLLASACGPGGRTAEETLLSYMQAVQEEDLDSLFCLSAGAAEAPELGESEAERRAGFGDWARAQYDFYFEGRDLGRVELEGHGIVEAKLFTLGKGAFYSIDSVRTIDSGMLEVDIRVRFGYSRIDLSRLSPGTTFYLCGEPLGRIHSIVVPAFSRDVTVNVLESVVLRWNLVHRSASDLCSEGWAVSTVEPLEDMVSSETISWSF
jgi:hypothetical protein